MLRLKVRPSCKNGHPQTDQYPDTDLPPTEVTFRLSPSYGLTTGHEVNEWFIDMLREHDEFVVKTDKAGKLPMPFWSETVRRVVVG